MSGCRSVGRFPFDSYEDPGPYEFPQGTVSRKATAAEMEADGITVDMPAAPKGLGGHGHMMKHKITEKE